VQRRSASNHRSEDQHEHGHAHGRGARVGFFGSVWRSDIHAGRTGAASGGERADADERNQHWLAGEYTGFGFAHCGTDDQQMVRLRRRENDLHGRRDCWDKRRSRHGIGQTRDDCARMGHVGRLWRSELESDDRQKPAVVVSTPAVGANVVSPIHIEASAIPSSGRTIVGWWIYLDSVGKYHAGAVDSITANIAASTGSHTLVVRAWESAGVYGDQTLTVDVKP
jgi:hypothetical protein